MSVHPDDAGPDAAGPVAAGPDVAGPDAGSAGNPLRLLPAAVVVGLIAAAGATLFVVVEHELQHFLWHGLPEALGHHEAPGWLIAGILIAAAVVVFAGMKLPGHGGHSPLAGLGLDIGPESIGSVVVVALASLSAGVVLGPEAPLMAVGTALAAVAARGPFSPARKALMLVGALAAVGVVFGNPLVTSILLLEFAVAMGGPLASFPILICALAGLAGGYLLQVGIGDWPGVGESVLAVPGLQPYANVQGIDVLVAMPLAVAVACVAIAATLGARLFDRWAVSHRLPALLGAALVIAGCAVAARVVAPDGSDLILFSGQSAMADYLGLAGAGTALAIMALKGIAYTASLGSGFRGGAIFPAIALGVLLAVAVSHLLGSTSQSALVAAAIAAAIAAVVKLPFTSLVLATMLTMPAGGAASVLAILGTIVGLVARLSVEKAVPSLAQPPAH